MGDHRLTQGLDAGGGHGILHPRLVHEAYLRLCRMDVHVHLLLGDGDVEQRKGIPPRHHPGIVGLLYGGEKAHGANIPTVHEQGLHGPVGPGDLLVSHKTFDADIPVI